MAKKKKEESPEAADSVLVTAAKGIGTAAGKIAAAAGVTEKPATPPKPKVPKLAPKNKSRLPRRQKKAQAKKAK